MRAHLIWYMYVVYPEVRRMILNASWVLRSFMVNRALTSYCGVPCGLYRKRMIKTQQINICREMVYLRISKVAAGKTFVFNSLSAYMLYERPQVVGLLYCDSIKHFQVDMSDSALH